MSDDDQSAEDDPRFVSMMQGDWDDSGAEGMLDESPMVESADSSGLDALLAIESAAPDLPPVTVSISVPADVARESLASENAFLKSQIASFYSELESLNREKNELFRDRCEAVRRATDQVSLVEAELETIKTRKLELELERDRYRGALLGGEANWRACTERASLEKEIMEKKITHQTNLISVLEEKDQTSARLQQSLDSVSKELSERNAELFRSKTEMAEMHAKMHALEDHREELLRKLVTNKENKRASDLACDILGKSKWSLSELVDELVATKSELSTKRASNAMLQSAVEETQKLMPEVEATRARLHACELQLRDTTHMNAQLREHSTQQTELFEQVSFEKAKIETDLNSVRIRTSELGRQLATVLHENEMLRSKTGVHGGPGRSNPLMRAAVEDEASVKRVRVSVEGGVTHFRTVMDLIEQNAHLREKTDNLLNECELASQREVAILKSKAEKLESINRDLLAKRESDRLDFDRILSRVEKDQRAAQSEADKLRRLLEAAPTGAAEEEVVAVLRGQLKMRQVEFASRAESLQAELSQLAAVHTHSVGEIDKLRESLKREIDQRMYFEKVGERLKAELRTAEQRHRDLVAQLSKTVTERDSSEIRLSDAKTNIVLLEQNKRELVNQVSCLKASVASLEAAYSKQALQQQSEAVTLAACRERLEQESAVYQRNSNLLQTLYAEESAKNKQSLAFYQSAFEEQSKRCSELAARVDMNAEAEIARIENLNKHLAQSVAELTVKADSAAAHIAKRTQLEVELKSATTQLAAREKDLSRVDGLMKLKDKRIGQLEEELSRAELARSSALAAELTRSEHSPSSSPAHVPELVALVEEYHRVVTSTIFSKAQVGELVALVEDYQSALSGKLDATDVEM